jgi:hypothetical protein
MKGLSLLLTTGALSITLFSCQPEPPEKPVEPGTGEPTDTSQISKNLLGVVSRISGVDTTTLNCRYDNQGRLAWYSNTSTKQGYLADTSKIVRDDAGRIKSIIYRSRASSKFADPKLDSVAYKVFYNSANARYTHKTLAYKAYGFNFKDSSAYTYDAQNRLIKEEAYYFDFQKTKAYQPSAKRDLDYDATGNVKSLKTIYYKVDGINDYPYEITYTYDDKGVNLLNLGEEAVVLGLEENFSAHTLKTMVSTYPQNPAYNRSLTYKYTYNTKYRPLKADVSDAVTGKKSTHFYTYQ